MSNETQKPIEKPWAIYSYDVSGAWDFGKVVRKDESPNPRNVKTFDNPVKMLAYFLVHQRKIIPLYDKKSVVKAFLLRFPDERNNLEKLLAQRPAKCTSTYSPFPIHIHTPEGIFDPELDFGELEEDFGGCLHETYAKDKIPHPNKKY